MAGPVLSDPRSSGSVALQQILEGYYLQSETVVVRPVDTDGVGPFNAENAAPDEFHDDVLRTSNFNWISGNSYLLQCAPDRPAVVDRQPVTAVEGDSYCRPFACTEALPAGKAKKELDLCRIVDALFDEVTRVRAAL